MQLKFSTAAVSYTARCSISSSLLSTCHTAHYRLTAARPYYESGYFEHWKGGRANTLLAVSQLQLLELQWRI